ncbi:MAG: hemerythrin [Methylotenera sp.]|nr:MAG: hemerythrin [Methylotenera sp.]PPD18916.1 MAG: hemerythrin [Methylotenera sp.]
MNIYEALRESHDEQRKLCAELLASEPNAQLRKQMFKSLKVELEAHAAAEERFLYCPIMMEDAGLSISRHALSEHHEMEEMMEELTTNDPTVQGWLTRAKALCDKVNHHLDEEEKAFFQLSGKLLSDKQKNSLATDYLADFKRMKIKYSS